MDVHYRTARTLQHCVCWMASGRLLWRVCLGGFVSIVAFLLSTGGSLVVEVAMIAPTKTVCDWLLDLKTHEQQKGVHLQNGSKPFLKDIFFRIRPLPTVFFS